MGDDEGPSWVEGRKRPRPSPMSGCSLEVSRQSGLGASIGTFGKASRFAESSKRVIGPGASSPNGHLFYHRNQLYKSALEEPKSCTQGVGERPKTLLLGNPPNVGPGSYNIVHSAKGLRSALDGPEYCSTTIKVKLPSSLTALALPSPGPHARYEVRKPLDDRFLKCEKERLGHGGRDRDFEDRTEVGPGTYQVDTYKSVAISASCPNLKGDGERCREATGGTKRCLKSTFGIAPRFSKEKVPNSSPQGDRYYAHSNHWGEEQYLKGARSCSFGACGKTDMANPLKGPRHDVSPATYYPEGGFSAAYKTSALDGLAYRASSPVHQFAKNASSGKDATSGGHTMFGRPPGGGSAGDGLSPGGGGSPGGAISAGGGNS